MKKNNFLKIGEGLRALVYTFCQKRKFLGQNFELVLGAPKVKNIAEICAEKSVLRLYLHFLRKAKKWCSFYVKISHFGGLSGVGEAKVRFSPRVPPPSSRSGCGTDNEEGQWVLPHKTEV